MIRGTFRLGGEMIEVVVEGTNLLFRDMASGTTTTLAGLKLNKAFVFKEYPDLENHPEWKKEVMKRMTTHLKKYRTEGQRIEYVKDELTKFGYSPLIKQRGGFRPQKW